VPRHGEGPPLRAGRKEAVSAPSTSWRSCRTRATSIVSTFLALFVAVAVKEVFEAQTLSNVKRKWIL